MSNPTKSSFLPETDNHRLLQRSGAAALHNVLNRLRAVHPGLTESSLTPLYRMTLNPGFSVV